MKTIWFNFISILTLVFLASACAPVAGSTTPIPPVTLPPLIVGGPTTSSAPSNTSQPSQANPSSNATAKPATGTQAQSAPPASGPLLLRILSPQDGATVSAAQIQVNGLATPGEVVTVNDNIILVGTDGQFQATVSLDQGPNLIEVIASNNTGNETTVELTVTYQP